MMQSLDQVIPHMSYVPDEITSYKNPCCTRSVKRAPSYSSSKAVVGSCGRLDSQRKLVVYVDVDARSYLVQ